MPTYEYECKRCSHKFEAFQSMSDDALSKCPECGGKVQRLINRGVGIIFKGSGFYKTDSRNASKSASSSKDSADSNKSDSGKSETEKSESSSSDSGSKETSSTDSKSEKTSSKK